MIPIPAKSAVAAAGGSEPPVALHLIDTLAVGGAELMLTRTLRLFPEWRHIVVTLFAPPAIALPASVEVRVLNAPSSPLRWLPSIFRLRSWVKGRAPTLFHTHLFKAGLMGRLACPLNVPFFYSIHSMYGADCFNRSKFALLAERLTVSRRHHMLAVSRMALDDYLKHVPNGGTADVLYNFVDPEFFTSVLREKYVAFMPLRCVSIGGLKAAKNYSYALRAMQALKDLPITLSIYGAGPEEPMLSRFIEEHGLSNVRLMGERDNLQEVLQDYDLYLSTSQHEGFGLAPLEALASGMPVVVTDIPAFREVLQRAGMYVSLSDFRVLSALLSDVYTGKKDLGPYLAVGASRAREVGDPLQYKQRLLTIYRKYGAAV